jgi:hypothetical protein
LKQTVEGVDGAVRRPMPKWTSVKPLVTESALHLVGVYDFAALLLAFILRYQDEALALARVHRLAFVVEALASALTLAAIDAKTSY